MDLEATVAELAPRLLRYCRGRVLDASLAEEAAQDALAALVRRWRRSGPPESPEAFVFAIARRRAGRLLWKRRLLDPLEALRGYLDPRPNPEQDALGRSRVARVLAALHGLRGPDREVLLLVVAGELDGDQAAAVLGISRSALKMRLHRARARLKQSLEEPCHERTGPREPAPRELGT